MTANSQVPGLEEAALALPVGLHVAVVVEVVTGEIGEHRGCCKAHPRYPSLVERVRGDLHDDLLRTVALHLRKLPVHVDGVGEW